MYDFFLGRQPIYNRSLSVIGYELLFRSSDQNVAAIPDSEVATSQVVLNAVLEMGLDRLVGPQRAFINVSREFVLHDYVLTLDKERVVLELVENQRIDDDLLARLRFLAHLGYWIALDNYVLLNSTRGLVDVARFIKLNVRGLSSEELRTQFDLLRGHQDKLIAERVQLPEEFELCDRLGFEYFQGFFLTQPSVVRGKRLPANRLAIVQLLAAIQHPETNEKRIEEIISKDLFLSYRLLRYINSAHFNLPNKIDSIHRALITIGIGKIKTWASLIALSKLDDKPHDLVITALARARMCEQLAQSVKREHPQSYFIVGLFSVLDAVMDQPMEAVLEALPLTDDIRVALTKRIGDMGDALRCVLAYERGHWLQVKFGNLDSSRIIESYLDAIDWAGDLGTEMAVA
jgi:EAL and modified HD-GYP domain-containing signal transduction protein